ncbi:ABC transporter permease [Streptomyces sp. NPDC006879]|uniref:ABC transporter permease n=1 Tax=Streptomyces sp. NPDC006879 TaxID=3364767 RepID=UPI0036C02571
MMPVWIAVSALLVTSIPNALETVYDTTAERAELARSISANSAFRALYGNAFGDSIGALTAWRGGVLTGLLAAAMSLTIVVRHTREEEETGRQELLSAAVVGRRAPLTAALLAAVTANAALGLLVIIGLAPYGLPGAVALGAAVTSTGLLFATVAALAAQLAESARAAKGLAAGFLALAFLLRAAGDAGSTSGSAALTWLSPLGWSEYVRPFGGERWWVFALFAAALTAQCALAYLLAGRRDLGRGLLPGRPGPAVGRLASAGALAWRLQRGATLGWALGFLIAGLVFGRMAQGAADLVGDNEQTRTILERMGGQAALIDTFLAAMSGMLGMVAALQIVASVLRLHGEEQGQRAEPVLALALGRLRWAGSHLLIAFAGAAATLLLGGLGLGLGSGHDLGALLTACLVQVPAVWVLGGLTVLLYGALAEFAAGAWAAAGITLAIGWLGPALNLPDAVLYLSPFSHLPKLPGAAMAWGAPATLTGIAVVLVAAGLGAFRRRDLAG